MQQSLMPFVARKLTVVRDLDSGGCGAGYGEAVLVTAGLLSGMAADLWPGTGIDRVRFIELWSQYADGGHRANRVSVPLLVTWLKREGRPLEARQIESARQGAFGGGNQSRVLISDDVDLEESAVLLTCPSLTLKEVRQFSYGTVFYSHVRSAMVHEFHFDGTAVGVAMTERDADVSYSNRLDRRTRTTERLIHFHMPWLIELTRGIVRTIDPLLAAAAPPRPATWWIQGR